MKELQCLFRLLFVCRHLYDLKKNFFKFCICTQKILLESKKYSTEFVLSNIFRIKRTFSWNKNYFFFWNALFLMQGIQVILYIIIMDEKVLVLGEKLLSKFSSNLYVLRPPESEKTVFTKVSVCLSVCSRSCAALLSIELSDWIELSHTLSEPKN